MLTTGPFVPALNVPIAASSPYKGTPGAAAVQVQNLSGFQLFASTPGGGQVYSIPPLMAATLPLAETAGVNLSPVVQLAALGSITLVWLVAGESAPVPDGALAPSLVSALTPQVALDAGTHIATGGNYNKTFALAASIRAVAVVVKWDAAGTGAGSITVTGAQTGYQYVNDTLGPNDSDFVAPILSALDTSVVVVVNNGSAGGATIFVAAEQEAVSSWVQSSDLAGNSGQPLYVKNRTMQTGPTGGLTTATPLGVLELGGMQHSLTALAASPTLVLPAPGGANPYRLHAIAWDGVNAGGGILLAGTASNVRYFRAATGVTDGFALLGGLLCAEGLEVFFATAGNFTVHYDNVHVFGMNPWPPA